MDIKHIREAAQKMEAAFRSAEAAKLAQEELALLFPDETTRRAEIGRALSDQAKRARDLIESASGHLRQAADELHEKWAEGERAMRGEGEFRSDTPPPTPPPAADRFASARGHFEAFEASKAKKAEAWTPTPADREWTRKLIAEDDIYDRDIEKLDQEIAEFDSGPGSTPTSLALIAWVEEDSFGMRSPRVVTWVRDPTPDEMAGAQAHALELLQISENVFSRVYVYPWRTPGLEEKARAQVMAELAELEADIAKTKADAKKPTRKPRRSANPKTRAKAKAKKRAEAAIDIFAAHVRENPPQHGWDGKRVTVSEEILATPAGVKTERGFWDRIQPGDESIPPPVYVGLPATRTVGPHMAPVIIVKVNATRSRIVVRTIDGGILREEKYSWRPSRAVYGPIGDSSTFLQLGKAVDYHDPGV